MVGEPAENFLANVDFEFIGEPRPLEGSTGGVEQALDISNPGPKPFWPEFKPALARCRAICRPSYGNCVPPAGACPSLESCPGPCNSLTPGIEKGKCKNKRLSGRPCFAYCRCELELTMPVPP